MSTALHAYCYQVDASDRLTWVDPWWLAFAQENGAPELTEERVLGRCLWDFLGDDTTRAFYEEVHNHVRAKSKAVVLPFRCDSPTLKRHMRLSITPGDAGSLHYKSTLVGVEPCGPLTMLNAAVVPTADFVTMCSCCKRCLIEAHGWLEVEDVICLFAALNRQPTPGLRYTICSACAESLQEMLTNGDAA